MKNVHIFSAAPGSFTKIADTDCDYDVSFAAEGDYVANCDITDSDGLTGKGRADISVGLYHGMSCCFIYFVLFYRYQPKFWHHLCLIQRV